MAAIVNAEFSLAPPLLILQGWRKPIGNTVREVGHFQPVALFLETLNKEYGTVREVSLQQAIENWANLTKYVKNVDIESLL